MTEARLPEVLEDGDRPAVLGALLASAPGLHLATDATGVIVGAWGADLGLLGLRPEFLVGMSLLTYVRHESRPLIRGLIEGDEVDPRPVSVELRSRKGERVALMSARRLEHPPLICWTITVQPSTPETPAEVADARRTEQLRGAFERLHQGIVIVDRRLRVVLANSAARRLLASYLREGTQLQSGALDLRDFAARAFGARDVVETEMLNGESYYRVAAIPPVQADDSVVLLLTDQTENASAERVEREFVANASHELRTPLATISGAIEILQSGAKDVPEARDRFLRHIEREASRLGRLVGALLTLARVQAGHELPEVGAVPVRPLLEEAASRLVTGPHVDVVVACPPALQVVAHPDLLLEAVMNLGTNAAKFTERGRIVFAAVPRNDVVAIEVRDTGRGIPEEAQGMLFDRFFRADSRSGEGFGIGLAIVREAVNALGGGVEVESVIGEGTTVRITLAQAKQEVAA